MEEDKAPAPALGGRQRAHNYKKNPMPTPKWSSIFDPLPPNAFGRSSIADLHNPSLSSSPRMIQSCGIATKESTPKWSSLFDPLPPNAFGRSSIADLNNSSLSSSRRIIQPHSPANLFKPNLFGSREAVFRPIAHNGPRTIINAIGNNMPVTGFDDGEQYPFSLKRGGQKEAGRLEGSCHSFEPPCKKGPQMSLKSSCATTVISEEEEEELDLSLHL